MMRRKFKQKVYRKYEDYISAADLIDPDALKPLNLSISDFNAQGQVANPRAPCVVTTIDPEYINDASRQRICRKFRMKTDILRLREITRNKFMYYATQEMYLDKKREMAHQEKLYKEAVEFHTFADESLKKMESDAFKEMIAIQQQLKKLKENKVADELNEVKLEHQRVLMEVQDIYGRFKYLLKLISYFDDTIEDHVGDEKLAMPVNIVGLEISEKNPAGLNEVNEVQVYMDQVVRPYLAKRSHLNSEIWVRGYERNRMKVSNYNRRFTHLALLNHIVGMLHDKAQKTYDRRTVETVFLKNPEFLKTRVITLQERAHELFYDFESKYKKDKLNIKLNSIVPVILKSTQRVNAEATEAPTNKPVKSVDKQPAKQWRTVENTQNEKTAESQGFETEQESTLVKVQKIQAYVLDLLGKLDSVPQCELQAMESRVRRRLQHEKELSRRALVKQNRLDNWLEHFKKHHRLQQGHRNGHDIKAK